MVKYGHDEVEIFNDCPDRDYDVRLDYAFEQYCKEIKEKFPINDMNDDTAFILVTDMLTVHDEIYTEIGLLAGIELAMQLYTNKDIK